MSKFSLIATNVLTALVTIAVTSLFWIAAYQGAGEPVAEANPASVALPPAIPSGSSQTQPARTVSAPVTKTVRYKLIVGPTGVAIPVLGVRPNALMDTYKQARAGGARVHDAIDIMAPAGTPVIAAAPGMVEKLYFSPGGGGITAYVRSTDGRWSYYYAHLQNYARGLHEGQRLAQGDLIGSVGSTGNANPAGPHLHFAIHRMESGQRWHEGSAINPYPLLAGNRRDR